METTVRHGTRGQDRQMTHLYRMKESSPKGSSLSSWMTLQIRREELLPLLPQPS
jgi:hypothetical protein